MGPEHYPTRDYGAFALPAGVYTSLRVTLGAGAGHNWWCVIFPPLCAQAAGPVGARRCRRSRTTMCASSRSPAAAMSCASGCWSCGTRSCSG
ncbi:MAG: stage II sporulation protein R [Oscillospiraceae bacterium]